MTVNKELDASNFSLYAARNYTNPRILDAAEFYEDLSRFKYIKKLFTRYEFHQELREQLIINHIISIFNVFEYKAAVKMCFFKVSASQHPALKTFLLFLNYIRDDEYPHIPCDLYVTKKLNNI